MILALLLSAIPGLGAVINVDFGVGPLANNLAVAPDLAGNVYWNSVYSGNGWPSVDWRDSAGNPTNVRVTQTSGRDGDLSAFWTESNAFGVPNSPSDPQKNFLCDYTWIQGTEQAAWNITNLTGSAYDIYVYSVVMVDQFQTGQFTIGGTTLSTTNSSWTTGSTYQEGVNYVVFRNVAPTSGSIGLSMVRSDPLNTYAGSNGLQIVEAVPEPGSAMIAAIGGAAGLVWMSLRRLRRRSA